MSDPTWLSGLMPNATGVFLAVGTTSDRDALPTSVRKAKMLVRTADGVFYELGVGLTNADWTVTTLGGGGSAIPAPALVATSNIALTGIVTVDGLASNAVTGDVLATAQTTAANNGYWTPNAGGAWTRPSYYNSDSTVAAQLGQTSGAVIGGTLGLGSVWFQSAGITNAGAKTWNKLATPSLLQDTLSTTLPAQTKTQHKGVAIIKDAANGRNIVDHGRADPREYGALAIVTETTGTCAAGGSAAITLAAENGHEDGSWLLMHQAGPAHGLATPAAPTAIVQGTAGSTQWEFKVVAMTRSYGYTAASPVTNVTNGPAVFTEDVFVIDRGTVTSYTPANYIELFFTDVPGAMWYLIYARTGGTGTFNFYGAAIAHPHSYYEDVPANFRFKGNARGVTSGVPSTAPASAVPNALRTQVISGGRTTSITVKPKPYNAASATIVEHCAMIPIDDAIDATAGGAFGSRYGGQIVMAPGTYPITGDVRLERAVTLRGAHKGKSSSSVILQTKHGVQIGIDAGFMAALRQPGELVRVGDRRQATIHGKLNINYTTVFYCTAVTSTDGTWGVTATGGDPAWDFTAGAATTDGEVTWRANGAGGSYYTDARDSHIEGIYVICPGTSGIPSGRTLVPRNLRSHWRGYTYPGSGAYWTPGMVVTTGQYLNPSQANANGKMLRCSVGGATGGGAEPAWSRVNGTTHVDNTATFVVVDKPMVQGAAVLATMTHYKRMAVSGVCGTGFVDNGDISRGYKTDDSTTNCDMLSAYEGHGQFIFGSDAQQSYYRVKTYACGGGLAYCDDSFYGNRGTPLCGDNSGWIQNTPSVAQNNQKSGWLLQAYSESGYVDWNQPGRVQGGAGLDQHYVGNAINDGFGPIDAARAFDTGLAPGAQENFYFGSYGVGGYGFRSSQGTLAGLSYYECGTDWNNASKRIRHGLTVGASPTAEDAVYSGRGRMRVFPLGLRVGAGGFFNNERLIQPVLAAPTVGAFAPGDVMPWAQDSRRLSIIPTRFGAEGKSARANSTVYALGVVRTSTGNSVFVCVQPGTSAASEPAGLNTAAVNDFVQDNTVWWQMVLTSTYNQTADLRGLPNWDAEYIALSNADQTINGAFGSPCFECATATANRTITLGTTYAMPGDGLRVRVIAPVGFTWTFVNGGPGAGNAAVLPVNTTAVLDFVMNKAGNWQLQRPTPYTVPQSEQSGTATLVAGVSAAISANIATGSIIIVTLKTPNTDALTVKYAALGTDRTTGTPGSFKITALTSAGGGAINTADVSTLDWRVYK